MLETKGAGDLDPGDLAVVRPGRGRARIESRLGRADDVENVLEALLVERGAPAAVRAARVPGRSTRRIASTSATS